LAILSGANLQGALSCDKLFFVNSKGEKAAELTGMRLVQELKAGSVKILTGDLD
jgi:hypothetical protein